jgi:hypothetical protein
VTTTRPTRLVVLTRPEFLALLERVREVGERDGDYFGPAVNRAARLIGSLMAGRWCAPK